MPTRYVIRDWYVVGFYSALNVIGVNRALKSFPFNKPSGRNDIFPLNLALDFDEPLLVLESWCYEPEGGAGMGAGNGVQ